MGTRETATWLVRSAVLLAVGLGLHGIPAEASIVHRAISPAQQEGGPITVGSSVSVTGTGGAGLNLRSAPLTNSDVLGSLDDGDPARVLEGPVMADTLTWYRVSSPGLADSGWVDGQYLSAAAPGQPTGSGALAVGSTAWVGGTGEAGLRARAAPTLSAEQIGSLSDGTAVQVLQGPTRADGYTWYQVSADTLDTPGWVDGGALSTTPS